VSEAPSPLMRQRSIRTATRSDGFNSTWQFFLTILSRRRHRVIPLFILAHYLLSREKASFSVSLRWDPAHQLLSCASR